MAYFLQIDPATDTISWTTSPATNPIFRIDASTDIPEWDAGAAGSLRTLFIDETTDVIDWL